MKRFVDVLKSLWRPATGIFLAIWLVLMIGGRSRFFRDPGSFWHTVVGEQMLTTGRMIYVDSFSFTFAGQRWSPHQWLGECLMALAHRIDGLDTLLLVTATILASLYTWLACRLLRSGLHWSMAVVVVALTLAASSSHFHVRPHIGTIVCMGVTIAFLLDFDAGRIGLARMFWLVPIYWLWSNIHGGMLGGLGTIGFAVAGWTAALLFRRLVPPRSLIGTQQAGTSKARGPVHGYRDFAALCLLIAVCAFTALLNPYGVRLPQIWFEIMDSPVLPHIIQEHAPLNVHQIDGLMMLLFAALYLLALADVLVPRLRPGMHWLRGSVSLPKVMRIAWLLPLIWLYLACTRIRHAPLFAITAALALADMLPYTRWAQSLAQKGSDLFQFPVPADRKRRASWRPALIPIGVVLLALVCQVGRIHMPVIGDGWAELDPTYWPVELTSVLKARQHDMPRGTRIFNEYLFGGYLIYFAPGYRVLVDDRCELYGDRWLEDYVKAEEGNTASRIHEWERSYPEFDLALTRTNSGYDQYFSKSSEWSIVQSTQTATMYERRHISMESVAERAK